MSILEQVLEGDCRPEWLPAARTELTALRRDRERLDFFTGSEAESRMFLIARNDQTIPEERYGVWSGPSPECIGRGPTPRAAIDAAMEEGDK